MDVETASEMLDAVKDACQDADVLIMAAAVADFRPEASLEHKLKKGEEELLLRLARTTDILATISGPRGRVGFAAETEDLNGSARKKLVGKRLDLVVANRVDAAESPFGSDANRAVLIDAETEEELPLLAKRDLADRILDRVVGLLDTA